MKKMGLWFGVFVFSLLVIPIVSAEITISGIQNIYNFGDELESDVLLSYTSDVTGFFTAKFICSNGELEIYKIPVKVKADEEKNVEVFAGLEKGILGELSGECRINVNYNGESQESEKFKISKEIKIEFDFDKKSFKPGENVRVFGTAMKENGKSVEGFAEAHVAGLSVGASVSVVGGDFNFDMTLPSGAAPGSYNITLRVYEKSGSETTNEGIASSQINIEQIIKSIDISLGSESIRPKNDLTYKIILKDQIGGDIVKGANVEISGPSVNDTTRTFSMNTGEEKTFSVGGDFTPGTWKIRTNVEGFERERTFVVEELMEASFEIVNGSLYVKNTGNVQYNSSAEVFIGEENVTISVALGVGEDKSLKLYAPDGEYPVSVSDSSGSHNLGSTYLTGRAVSVGEPGKGFLSNIWLWLFLIIIFAGAFYYLKFKRKKGEKPHEENDKKEAKTSGNITGGKREEVAIVALKINNLEDIKNAKKDGGPIECLNDALTNVKKSGARIYVDNEYRILIFSQTLTNDKNNGVLAVNAAEEVKKMFEKYNEHHSAKIDFGIGLNIGEMIVEKKDDKFRFTSIGNTVTSAKWIAGNSKGDILLSTLMHGRVVGGVKSEKIPSKPYWRVKKVPERGKHAEFVKKFLKGQKK